MIGHGESLEIVDRIIRAGYDVKYESSSIIYHHHPSKESDIKKKLYMYGIGDTAIHAHIFITTYDWRSLWWAMGGHQLYTLRKFIKRFFNLYPLPSSYIIYSFMGSAIGAILYIYRRLKTLY